jgi:hypothetical protein
MPLAIPKSANAIAITGSTVCQTARNKTKKKKPEYLCGRRRRGWSRSNTKAKQIIQHIGRWLLWSCRSERAIHLCRHGRLAWGNAIEKVGAIGISKEQIIAHNESNNSKKKKKKKRTEWSGLVE